MYLNIGPLLISGIHMNRQIRSAINEMKQSKSCHDDWRTELSDKKVQKLQEDCKETIDSLGYET